MPEPRVRVVLVDDNELTLNGFAGFLRMDPRIELLAAFGHGEALAWGGDWAGVDVVIVDAANEESTTDQLPGVSVVRHIRLQEGDARPVIVIVTGHYCNDGLRFRMAKADADFFFERANVWTADILCDVVLHPDRYRRGVPRVADRNAATLLGVDENVDLEALVSYIIENGLEDALDPTRPIREKPRSRRWQRHRRELTRRSGVDPRNITTGNRPQAQDSASIRQLSHLWAWATRVKRSEDGLRRSPDVV